MASPGPPTWTLVALTCFYSYMPTALYFYAMHHNHPLIKHRKPHLIASTCGLLTAYSLGSPVVMLWRDTCPAIVFVVVVFVAPIFAITTLLVSALVVVLHHKITELLVAPTQFPLHLVPTLTPTAGCSAQPINGLAFSALALSLPRHFLPVVVFQLVFVGQYMLMAGAAIVLANLLAPLVDTFHQREAYQRSFACAGTLVVVSLLLALVERVFTLYYSRHLLNSLAAQANVVCHVLLPLRHVCTSSILSLYRPGPSSALVKTRTQVVAASDAILLHAPSCTRSCKKGPISRPASPFADANVRRKSSWRGNALNPSTRLRPSDASAMARPSRRQTTSSPCVCTERAPGFANVRASFWSPLCPSMDRMEGHALLAHLATEILPRFQAHSTCWSKVHQLAAAPPPTLPRVDRGEYIAHDVAHAVAMDGHVADMLSLDQQPYDGRPDVNDSLRPAVGGLTTETSSRRG
ncbi:Aste57867_24541 [Aphanomyces stellatus]|uniref:Aste57867_24541 protein n=1 Tax=Aphanomyces stellatus TaxID=120398 RepID=A0A485LSL5_9STRA|nr:hypothetical protein As57867_024464 [Aphanomyces stellatus]VFU01180.1 Aste57867_24541 [Aphanomyces stellatus]